MRVVHVSPVDVIGGAARGAYGLHKAMCAANVDSLMFVLRKYSDDPTVVTPAGGPARDIIFQGMRDQLDRLPLRLYDWNSANWWTVGWLPFDIKKAIDALRPDIVQFHWAGRGAAPIKTLARLGHYPLVWTLRDMWPLTGGCHYAGDCDRFLSGCGRCPQLNSDSDRDISAWQWRRKHRIWRNVTVTCVAPSRWMARFARQSPLFRGNEVCMIPNGVDITRFKPLDKAMARQAWDLPQDRKIIMFGALNSTNDPRKGFLHLAKALHILRQQGWDKDALAVVFGASNGTEQMLGIPARYVGSLRDDISLALLYSCADVMVVPSVQENAGKTAIEAMSCGVPVVAFANTGQFDIVDHQVNGYLADNLSAEDLARGMAWCLERRDADDSLSQQARAKAVNRFDIGMIADRYMSLYERRLANQPVAEPYTEKLFNEDVRTGGVTPDRLSASTDSGRVL